MANCSDHPVGLPSADLPDLASARMLLGTHLDAHLDAAAGTLRPWESRLYDLG